MKHSLSPRLKKQLGEAFSLLDSCGAISLKVDSPSLLPFVLSFFDFKKLIICENETFDPILTSFGLFPTGVVGFPFILKESKKNQVVASFHEDLFNRSSSFLSSSFEEIDVCVVDERSLDSPAVFFSPPPSARVGKGGVSFNQLLSFLQKQKYTEVSRALSPGDFVVRGGVIDVFSFGEPFPFRCGFLGNSPSVLFYNPSSGDIVKRAAFCVVSPFPGIKTKTVRETCLDFFYVRFFAAGSVSIVRPFCGDVNPKNCNLSFFSFSYKKHQGSSLSAPFVYSDLLLTSGCFFLGSLFLPSWFSGSPVPALGSIPLSRAFSNGDYYVHASFGICQYLGLSSQKGQNEKVLLRFVDGKISLDIKLLGCLSFYSSFGSSAPPLDSLNKPGRWRRRRDSSYKRAEKFVGSVLQTYIKREGVLGCGFVFDSGLVSLFLSSFPFVDTPDQAQAWSEISKDLCSDRPMHRLLCGDVGFGKTELAMRAVFLACINKKSSVIMAPTTILSRQLFYCFVERLAPFGISILQVSRLTKNGKKNIALFVRGKADVLVGTHSIARSASALKKASLVIIDDEHRFGVKDKERALDLSPSSHHLSLSATPIPRTLQLSLSEIRNISTLFTPPAPRKPIITNIYFFNKSLFISIIMAEIVRGGQVFVVDNSVKNVRALFSLVRASCVGVSAGLLFGSMKKPDIEKTMLAFINKKLSVLVSTTIIESGIDVPSANTIIINNADCFGLSQLHQLRGRVGRADTVSFASLFVSRSKKLSVEALSRLKTIKINSALGSGYQLALDDLRARGAGSLFGYGQSGQGSVGFECYTKLLSLAVKRAKKGASFLGPAKVLLEGAFIPVSFVSSGPERAFYYKSIYECSSQASLNRLEQKTVDLFGSLPGSFLLLFDSQRLSLLAENTSLRSIALVGGVFSILFASSPGPPSSFLSSLSSFFSKYNIKYACFPAGVFLKIQFSYVVEDSYILISSLIKKLYA